MKRGRAMVPGVDAGEVAGIASYVTNLEIDNRVVSIGSHLNPQIVSEASKILRKRNDNIKMSLIAKILAATFIELK